MSIDKLPKIAHALQGLIQIGQCHDPKDSSKWVIQAWFSVGHVISLEGDCCKTVQAALESLLAKFEEIGR